MILVSVICPQLTGFNDSSPIQWADIDMMLASVIISQPITSNHFKSRQCIEIVINPESVMYLQLLRDSDCSPLQCSDIDCNV